MDRKPVIVYCTPSLYIPGGIERVLTTKANYLADVAGYTVYIILTDGQDKSPYYPLSSQIRLIQLGIEFEELWDLPLYKKIIVYLQKQRIYKCKLRNVLFSIKPDITVSLMRREINFITSIKDGGKQAATYINYGKVETKGFNLSIRYNFANWVSVGGNFTQMDVRDKMKTSITSSAENLAYGERMPNLPYRFADSDISFYWRNLWKKGNVLTVTYDNQYLHSFTYYSSAIGSKNNDYVVPNQFSHNLTLSYSLQNGRYNVSLECRNFTNENLYDNFSLQKAGRAFYGKVRVYFGN